MSIHLNLTHRQHWMSLFMRPPPYFHMRFLLDNDTELTISRSGWINTRDNEFVPVVMREPFCKPYGAIYVHNDFNLAGGSLYMVPNDHHQFHTSWTQLTHESAYNDTVRLWAPHHDNDHEEPRWDDPLVPLPAPTFSESLRAIRARAQGTAAAAAAAQPAAAPRVGSLAEPRAYTPR